MARRSHKKRTTTATPSSNLDWLWSVILIAVVLLTYSPMWFAEYIWDDVTVVIGNPVIIGPLGLREIWTTPAADICPLTLTTFWAEFRLWGQDPLPYHLVNIIEHAACAILLWKILRLLRVPGAWLGAALWALHPVDVESVAWITEMKNTQSCLFFLLSIFFFAECLTTGAANKWNYRLTLLFAAMAMASKSSTVILPVVLGLCAWWLEGRWHWRNLVKVAPIFLMSVAAGAVSIWTQSRQIKMFAEPEPVRSWLERLVTAGDAVWFYLGKLVWPHPLMMIYPKWQIDSGAWLSYLPLLAVLVIAFILWLKRDTWFRPIFFAFTFFLTALLPVLGFVDMSFQHVSFVADHFQYLASMGPLALLGAAIFRLKDYVSPERSWQPAVLAAGLLSLLGITSWFQTWNYQDEQTLWKQNLVWNPRSWSVHYNLGVKFLHDQHPVNAIAQFRTVLVLSPNNLAALNSLSKSLSEAGRIDDALVPLDTALKLSPNNATLHNNLGEAYLRKGRVDDAIAEFRKSVAIDPSHGEAHYSLGSGLAKKGDLDEAMTEFHRALEIDPDDGMSHNNLGVVLLRKGRPGEAIIEFKEALRVYPRDRSARDNLDKAEAMAGQAAGAK